MVGKHNEMVLYYSVSPFTSMVCMDRDEEYYMVCYERQEYCVDGPSFFTRLFVFQGTCIYALDTEYVSYLMAHYVLSVRGPNDFKFVSLAFLKPFITLYITFLCRQCVPGVGTFIHNATFELSSSWYMHREYFSIV